MFKKTFHLLNWNPSLTIIVLSKEHVSWGGPACLDLILKHLATVPAVHRESFKFSFVTFFLAGGTPIGAQGLLMALYTVAIPVGA